VGKWLVRTLEADNMANQGAWRQWFGNVFGGGAPESMKAPEGGYLYNPEMTEELFPIREGTDYYNQAFGKGYTDLSDTALGVNALTDLFTNIREGRDITRRRKAAQGRQATLAETIESWRPSQLPAAPPEAQQPDAGMFQGYVGGSDIGRDMMFREPSQMTIGDLPQKQGIFRRIFNRKGRKNAS
jgi:hypothetical protein